MKAEYFAKHRAGQLTPVEGAEGLPKLFAKKMTSAEFSDCLDPKVIDGKPDAVINYSKACIASIVTENGSPYFDESDRSDLDTLGVDGLSPFVHAVNIANGLRGPKKPDVTEGVKP